MSIFSELSERNMKCELCGSATVSLPGGGWDNDRIYCSNRDCTAEYVFPTTTDVEDKDND